MVVLDPFGVRKIYPTNRHPNRAKPWYMGKGDWLARKYNGLGDWNDCPFHTENDYVVIDFGFNEKGRLPVLAKGDLSHTHLEPDQSVLRKRGFTGTKQDWKNVEITLYWKIRDVVIDPDKFKAMAFSVRGAPHHASWSECAATALYVQLYPRGSLSQMGI